MGPNAISRTKLPSSVSICTMMGRPGCSVDNETAADGPGLRRSVRVHPGFRRPAESAGGAQ
jgi:hypothetical protein